MKCICSGKDFYLDKKGKLTLLRWVNSIKGNQYFVAEDEKKNAHIYHVLRRNDQGSIVEIEMIK